MEISIGGRKFTVDDRSDKYRRAVLEVGSKDDIGAILAIYDRLEGLIRNEQGNKVENGPLWERYKRWKDEQPAYLKTLEDRDKSLDEAENRVRELGIKVIDHKRSLLGNLMTISAAIIAGLFILLTVQDPQTECTYRLAILTGIGFGFFIISASYYMMSLLSHDSERNDKHLNFVIDAHTDFVAKVGKEIVDLDSYEKYREKKFSEEKELKAGDETWVSKEIWFRAINWLFIISVVGVLVTFISAVL